MVSSFQGAVHVEIAPRAGTPRARLQGHHDQQEMAAKDGADQEGS
jgi:hypothetical protein